MPSGMPSVENDANEWRQGSPLAEVNRRAGEAVSVPPAVADGLVTVNTANLGGLRFLSSEPSWSRRCLS